MTSLRHARRDGGKATLRVIGCSPNALPADLRDVDGVEWAGFVDKSKDSARYLHLVAECNIGCLLSRAEAGGIALREYHALGLAVIGPNTGGATEHMIPDASIAIEPLPCQTARASKTTSERLINVLHIMAACNINVDSAIQATSAAETDSNASRKYRLTRINNLYICK